MKRTQTGIYWNFLLRSQTATVTNMEADEVCVFQWGRFLRVMTALHPDGIWLPFMKRYKIELTQGDSQDTQGFDVEWLFILNSKSIYVP